MTAAQKAAKEKFSKAIAYRSKTGVSLKEAFAHVYGKKVGEVKKKATPKKKETIKKETIVSKMTEKQLQDVLTKKLADKGISKDFLKNNFVFTKLGSVLKKKSAPKKKAAPKKVTGSHKDTKSHNVNIRVVSGTVGELSKSLVKKLNEIINEIEQRENVIIDVMGRKKQLIEKNGILWYKKWISDAKKIVLELKKHKTELKKLI